MGGCGGGCNHKLNHSLNRVQNLLFTKEKVVQVITLTKFLLWTVSANRSDSKHLKRRLCFTKKKKKSTMKLIFLVFTWHELSECVQIWLPREQNSHFLTDPAETSPWLCCLTQQHVLTAVADLFIVQWHTHSQRTLYCNRIINTKNRDVLKQDSTRLKCVSLNKPRHIRLGFTTLEKEHRKHR